jgi:protein-glutamine gamma-glutamyltransferase
MSAGAPAVVSRSGRYGVYAHALPPEAAATERPLVRLVAFTALALYGVLRWATLLSPAAGGRLAALLVLTVVLAAGGGALATRSTCWATAAAVIAVLAIFPLAGVPLAWVWHLRIAATVNGIGDGLAALPTANVPYTGINDWVRVVNTLGAAVLLLDAAIVLAFTPRVLGDVRRAGAALPLLALAIVPATLNRPALAYLQGLVLFALVAAFMWGERVRAGQLATACAIAALAGVAGLVVAPALDRHTPWVNYEALAGTISTAHVDMFDWNQTYGPLNWPRNGREILDVKAAHPEYWKAEDLDMFNGVAWTQGTTDTAPVVEPTAANLRRWTQTITVTIRGLETTDVIAAGYANPPQDIPAQEVFEGASAGTYAVGTSLGPGTTYSISTYSPQPTAEQLATAGTDYPGALAGYRAMTLPPTGIGSTLHQILFSPFHSSQPVENVDGSLLAPAGESLMRSSPYGGAFELAQTLASESPTPYAFVEKVMAYLGHGFTYNEDPPQSGYPLESFLFQSKNGYCQQFSGAMALLLRMGGLPARVAAGFTTGTLDRKTGQYVVTDIDAHDWVEVWFPSYGWVKFDPTPASAPARSGRTLPPILKAADTGRSGAGAIRKPESAPAAAGSAPKVRSGGGATPLAVLGIVALLVVAGLAAGAVLVTRRRGKPTGEELVAELERALVRCGRPVAGGVTLAGLEQRFRTSPEAAGYIRAIRLARFAGHRDTPTPEQRRALRAQLRAGLGMAGGVRALWALPPRWTRERKRGVPGGRLHSQ